ncbi:MAG: UDP-N-acetylglucosamine--N-acetylmuramyl-(pentapeptide) pyrophosphoryl-undecaprenol N-acetylglucosamine transferase, partial [Microgenomates bacterium OLB22]
RGGALRNGRFGGRSEPGAFGRSRIAPARAVVVARAPSAHTRPWWRRHLCLRPPGALLWLNFGNLWSIGDYRGIRENSSCFNPSFLAFLSSHFSYNFSMKVLITGGHITPAIAVADELRSRGHKVTFVGRQTEWGSETFEYRTIKEKDYFFIPITAGRITRTWAWKTFRNMLHIPTGFFQAFSILISQKPDVIMSFGGYIALPICIIGWLLRIPIITHEQTMSAGLTNRLIFPLAQKICLSFPNESLQDNPKVALTGNPVRSEIFTKHITDKTIKHFIEHAQKPLIFITGGSLGAHSLNLHIEALLPKLKKIGSIIHQTGTAVEYGDLERLSGHADSRYLPVGHIAAASMGGVFRASSLVISRAGANTVVDLMVVQKPAILVPLIWAAGGEQQKQAQYLEKYGVAEIFDQRSESQKLLELVKKSASY